MDTFLPVDLYIPGCPPTPEATLNAYILLHKRIQGERIDQVRWYRKDPVPEVPVPMIGGPDLVDVRRIAEVAAAARGTSDEEPS